MDASPAPSRSDKPANNARPSDGGSGDDPNSSKKPNASGSSNRRRTKTGCLTCRRRRIKCDEGRPTCNNCIKSKRSCEGYNQKVVFKDPISAPHYPGSYGSYGFINGAPNPLAHLAAHPRTSSSHGQLPVIAPKPPSWDYSQHPQAPHFGAPVPPNPPNPPSTYAYEQLGFNINTEPLVPAEGYGQQMDRTETYEQSGQSQWTPKPHPFVENATYYTASSASNPNHTGPVPQLGNQTRPLPEETTSPEQRAKPYASSDEDASMADSDDEDQTSKTLMAPVFKGFYHRDSRDASFRSFSSYAQNDALGQYMGSPHASELKDDAKRRLFEHFMKVTGPTMSLYERHPFDPQEVQTAGLGSTGTGGSTWGYTFPLISFQHPALLHAMLALASLQVSKLQNTPPMAAHKHYHISLRRIAKNLGSPLRRLQPATLAATLLLAYFEVWNSEHNKWCSHLYGASSLFAELPLRKMAKRCLPAKSLKERHKVMIKMGMAGIGGPLPKDPKALDFDLMTTLTGYRVTAEEYGLKEELILQSVESSVTEKEIENFENLRDLFWWYCKMDVYQGLLGGTKLFMRYDEWARCPPRAPISRLDATYGTYDHLMLLLARLVNFSSNDLPRKRRMNRPRGPRASGPSPPPFHGMVPTKGIVCAPMGFSPPKEAEPHRSPSDETDPQKEYHAVLREWETIQDAFQTFEKRLGPEFKPLSAEYTDRRDRPFGQALQYRTFSVAGLWMNYYMGLISLHRSHPDMPPTAMQSVGASARKTAFYSNQIGRIAVGLSDDCSDVSEISTVMAAAFLESSMCLFVAAVQFQDDEQRKWVVQRMHDITRLTGWQSARQIADGCESSWTKAAQLGRGPPYVPVSHSKPADTSVWSNPRRIDRRIMEIDKSLGDERRVVLARSDQAHYALGLLGVEGDLDDLELRDDTFTQRAAGEGVN